MPIADNLCKLQQERGESNYKLAKALGVHASSVANWREGKTKPMAVYLEKLADHYGVTIEQLKA